MNQTRLFVFFASLAIALGLAVAVWDINPWPTDAEAYYMPAAKELSHLHHLSQINNSLDEERIKWLHGKEFFVLTISWFQGLTGDTVSLRPLMLLGVMCIFFSSLLIFSIAGRLWDERIAVLAWFLFATSFWPYLYILFAKHQTQGLLFFLLAVYAALRIKDGPGRWAWSLGVGAAFAVSVFSSTVSALYVPFVLTAFFWAKRQSNQQTCTVTEIPTKNLGYGTCLLINTTFAAFGFLAVIIYANYPDILHNLKSYWDYVHISGQYNHFYYNQRALVQWIPSFDLKDTRGGWIWIIRYLFLVAPVLFSLYIAAVAYLGRRAWNLGYGGCPLIFLIVLSFSPVLLAEIKHVAQYGANYFPILIGMIFLVCRAAAALAENSQWQRYRIPVLVLALVHLFYNGYVFASDIYPSRMATTFIGRTLTQKGITDVFTYPDHPLRHNILDQINPAVLRNTRVIPIQSVVQVPSGAILVPPMSTDSIYRGSNGEYTDYDVDLILNEIMRQGRMRDYALGSFKTLSSSLIWQQEEEILAYRYLVLGQFKGGDKSRAWLLDAKKIRADLSRLLPSEDDLFLMNNAVMNIGSARKSFMYKGSREVTPQGRLLKNMALRMYAVGQPTDDLVAYVYGVENLQPVWIPYGVHFASQPVRGSTLGLNTEGAEVQFTFDPPIPIKPGVFYIVIYRTGKASDKDFYRIWSRDSIKYLD